MGPCSSNQCQEMQISDSMSSTDPQRRILGTPRLFIQTILRANWCAGARTRHYLPFCWWILQSGEAKGLKRVAKLQDSVTWVKQFRGASMSEMPDSREHHCHAQPVCG